MFARKVFCPVSALLLVAFSLIAQSAAAAGVQAVIRTVVDVRDGDGVTSGDIALFLNDTPLPVVAEQTVTLNEFDVLRAELSASATHTSGVSVLSDRRVTVDLTLDPQVEAATVVTYFSGEGETTVPTEGGFETARAGFGGRFDCDFFTTEACTAQAPELPPGFLSYFVGAESITIGDLGNEIAIWNEVMETGRRGGLETLDLIAATLNLRPPQTEGPPTTVSVGAQGLAIFQSTASGSGDLEIFVSDLSVIPVPAAAWLFASALAAIGWTRRRAR